MRIPSLLFFVTILALSSIKNHAQSRRKFNLLHVDEKGVLRYTKDKKEVSFFGVNYTTPFAHAYRAHKVLGVDLEKAIQLDVYHLARLGLDAFRVQVWDTEISDTVGNLLENTMGSELPESEFRKPYSLEVESIWLEKRK